MCDLCRQTPCNSLCPHADEPQGTKCDDCGEVIYPGDDYVDVTGGGILVVPESATNKTLTIEANKTYNLTLPAGTWESGKRYTYTLEIKQDDIVFVDDAPYVEEWDSENATGSVIIK